MIYNPKYKAGVCKVCGVKLPVQAWKTCFKHDPSSKNKDIPFNEIKKPYEDPYGFLEKTLPCKPFKYHFGYEINIPFNKYLRAKELLYDKWTIIGWK